MIIIIIGYCRVSTIEQHLGRQIDAMKENGAEKIFTEKVTGKKSTRPELMRMMEQLRQSDVVLISDLTRLSRSTQDLFSIVEQIQAKGADIKSLKETWLDTTTPHGKLMFTIFAGLSQFVVDLTAQHTREGLAAARARGRFGGRPKVNTEKVSTALKMYDSKDFTISEICKNCHIGKTTLYRLLNDRKKNDG